MMADYDDDEPPPLHNMAEQVQALSLKNGVSKESIEEGEQEPPIAVIQKIQGKPKADIVSKSGGVKKGFFDTPSKPRPKLKPELSSMKASQEEEIVTLKGKKSTAGGAMHVPDFMKLKPDEDAEKMAAMKSQLLGALKPTPDMVSKVMSNPILTQGFDDPDVMAAVNDIAENPQAIHKYKDNKKVLAFYAAMGNLAGDKLSSMGQGGQGNPK